MQQVRVTAVILALEHVHSPVEEAAKVAVKAAVHARVKVIADKKRAVAVNVMDTPTHCHCCCSPFFTDKGYTHDREEN